MATDILERQVIVFPIVTGSDFLGNADNETVDSMAVPLTTEYLVNRGGAPLRGGQTWAVRLALKYIDEDGAQTAVSLSDASSTVMQIWHPSTGDWIDSRTEDAVISDSGGLVELAIDGDGTAGTITIKWHQDETVTSGVHSFAILSDWTYSEPIAAGTIEIKPAVPTS